MLAVQEYFRSLGIYGATAFIYPLYGVSEIAQAFCRLCAVFGGLYLLRQPLNGIYLDRETSTCRAVNVGGQRVECSQVVMSQEYALASSDAACEPRERLARATLLVDGPVFERSEDAGGVVLSIPPETVNNEGLIQVVVLSGDMGACPRGQCKYLLQTNEKYKVRTEQGRHAYTHVAKKEKERERKREKEIELLHSLELLDHE